MKSKWLQLRADYLLKEIPDRSDALVVVSSNMWGGIQAAGGEGNRNILSEYDGTADSLLRHQINVVMNTATPRIVYGFGGGLQIDGAKHLATSYGCELQLIPTCLSTDAFLTQSAALRDPLLKQIWYRETIKPSKVHYPEHILDKAVVENIYGLGEICCHLTAGHRLENESEAFDLVNTLIDALEPDISKPGWWKPILEALRISVDIQKKYGTGAQDGLEHMVAHYMQFTYPELESASHGLLLQYGLSFMMLYTGDTKASEAFRRMAKVYDYPDLAIMKDYFDSFDYGSFINFLHLNKYTDPRISWLKPNTPAYESFPLLIGGKTQ